MFASRQLRAITGFALCCLASTAFSHGYIESPPSRQQHCGVEVKPDNPSSNKCDDAFAKYSGENSHWYSFMSVVAHNGGRKEVQTTTNVCGFDGESFNPAPWDTPAEWPVTSFSSGQQTFTWNISYGPHFSDTEELVLWITKPGFTYDPNTPLTWDDLEPAPFCDEQIASGDFSSNSAMSEDQGSNTISVSCNVPNRSGRHIIYGEWGRDQATDERFFSCVDVNFGGGGGGARLPPAAQAPAHRALVRHRVLPHQVLLHPAAARHPVQVAPRVIAMALTYTRTGQPEIGLAAPSTTLSPATKWCTKA